MWFWFRSLPHFDAREKTKYNGWLEYNLTRQFKKSMYEGHFAHSTDITYKHNSFSIPVGIRVNFGSKTKVFIETGGFADPLIISSRKGIMHTTYVGEDQMHRYRKTEIDEKSKLSNTVGLYVGIGLRIPISGIELIVKPDYKYGIIKLYSNRNDIFNRYFRINVGIKIK